MYNNELYHFGVKGMKWGHRKAQYTMDETRRRYRQGVATAQSNYSYAKKTAKQKRKQQVAKIKSDYKAERKAAKQAYNKELENNTQNTRKDLSKTSYSSVFAETVATTGIGVLTTVAGKALTAKGNDFVGAVLEGAGKGMTIGGLAAGAINAGDIYTSKRMKLK